MSERKAARPKCWPGHTFRRADIDSLLDLLRRDQDPKSGAFIGERFAFALLEKSPREMKAATNKLDDESGKELTDYLFAAELSLKTRLKLVRAAIARVAIASGAAPWVPPDQAEGAANG
jgi:hypothetical protein